ncbi:MAG: hypothetical protein MUC36_16870 [Planctomycetes bacterium]|jgi:hypothetical protein|nr:hypothetical protein [Planctomycetota bacterium]
MDAAPSPPPPWRWTLLAALPALLLLGWQSALVWPFFSDDAFISLRYAERLLDGHGLSWTDGERVEGYSNLLWVLLVAGLGGLGLDLVSAARLLGGALTALALLAIGRALRPASPGQSLIVAAVPLLAASTQVLLGWTFAGLEGPLVLCLLALGCGCLVQAHTDEPDPGVWSRATLLRASVPFALLCWTRPDGPLWVFGSGLLLGAASLRHGLRRAVDRAFWLGALPLLAVLLQLAFRLAWHGDVVPNTAHVKAELDPNAFAAGVDYVVAAVRAHAGLFATAGLGGVLLLVRGGARLALVLTAPVLLWLLYLALVGGDHFPGRRLLHGAIAPLALLAGLGLVGRGLRFGAAGALLLAAAAAWNVQLARRDAQTLELAAETWEWRGEVVGRELQRQFGDRQPLLAVDAAGAVPFYSQLPALDLLGLCDRTIATTPFPAWLQTMRPEVPRPPGHLRGNGSYVMERGPDLLLFSNPPGLPLPVFVSAAEFESDPRFLQRYRAVLVEFAPQPLRSGATEALRMPLWVRTDGVLAPATNGATIEVPAWWFGRFALPGPVTRRHQPPSLDAATEAAAAQHLQAVIAWFSAPAAVVIASGHGPWQLELRSAAGASATLPLRAGEWSWHCEPAEAAVELSVDAGPPLANGSSFRAADGDATTLTLRARPGAVLPQRLTAIQLRAR